jgi:xyloglucan-specific exo-beta-1,4-glucanase
VNAKKLYIYDQLAGRVYATANGGKKFAARASVPADGGYLRAVPGFEGNAWLPGGSAGLLRSTDSCATFARVTSVAEAYQVGLGKAAEGKSHPAVYLWGRVGGVTGIFRSDDEGATWARINDDRHQFGWINAIAGDPRIYGRVYLATGGRGIVYGEP